MEHTLDEILDQINNGNRKKALLLLKESHHDFISLTAKLMYMDRHGEVVRMLRVAYNIGYLKENQSLKDSYFD